MDGILEKQTCSKPSMGRKIEKNATLVTIFRLPVGKNLTAAY
jgi:hypothetical protein